MAEVITPFIGVGYVFPVRRFELEPFMRFGLGVLNYRLLNIDYESNNSSALNETVYFSDKKPVVFFNPNIGLDSRTKMSNLFSLTAALAFDYGKAPKNEILEKTSKNSNIIGMRNIYMQSNVHNFYFSLGIEVTFFNKIYAGEKNNYGAKK